MLCKIIQQMSCGGSEGHTARNLASERRSADSAASPANPTALTVVHNGAAGGGSGRRRRGWGGGRPDGCSGGRWGRRGTLADSDRGRAAALVPLSREDLVVERAHLHAERLPRVEVIRRRDRAADAFALAHGPELIERLRAGDRGRVGAHGLVDVVCRAVGGDRAHVRQPRAWVVCAEGIADVVLNERARGPSIDGEVRVAAGAEGTAVRDGPDSAILARSISAIYYGLWVAPTERYRASSRFRQRRLAKPRTR